MKADYDKQVKLNQDHNTKITQLETLVQQMKDQYDVQIEDLTNSIVQKNQRISKLEGDLALVNQKIKKQKESEDNVEHEYVAKQ